MVRVHCTRIYAKTLADNRSVVRSKCVKRQNTFLPQNRGNIQRIRVSEADVSAVWLQGKGYGRQGMTNKRLTEWNLRNRDSSPCGWPQANGKISEPCGYTDQSSLSESLYFPSANASVSDDSETSTPQPPQYHENKTMISTSERPTDPKNGMEKKSQY